PACVGSGACQGTCDGTSATACAFPGGDVTCEASCTSGKATHAVCDGQGACESTTETECGLYACGATECLTSCTDDGDCAQGAVCANGSCVVEDTDAGVDGGDEDAGIDAGNDAAVEDVPDAGQGADAGSVGDDAGSEPGSVDAPSEEADE